MSLAALARRMADAGATPEVIALALEAVEAAQAATDAGRAAARDRKRAQRQRQRDTGGDSHVTVTGQVTPCHAAPPEEKVSPTPPSKTQTPHPLSPPKGGPFPRPEQPSDQPAKPASRPARPAPSPGLEPLAEQIWELQPRLAGGSRRSTRPDVLRALQGAVKGGGQPEAILAACRAYYALPDSRKDGGQFARGAQVLLRDGRWRDYQPPPPQPPPEVTPELRARWRRHWEDTGEWKGPPEHHPHHLQAA